MADPVTIGMVALSAAGTIAGATSEAKSLRTGATNDEAAASAAIVDGARQSEDIIRAERATSAEAMAALGMNGTAIGTGSALDLITQNAVEREMDLLNARFASGQEARNLRIQATQKRSAAKGAMFGGIIRAGAQVLGGVSSMNNNARVAKASMPRLPGTTMPVPAPAGRRIGTGPM